MASRESVTQRRVGYLVINVLSGGFSSGDLGKRISSQIRGRNILGDRKELDKGPASLGKVRVRDKGDSTYHHILTNGKSSRTRSTGSDIPEQRRRVGTKKKKGANPSDAAYDMGRKGGRG